MFDNTMLWELLPILGLAVGLAAGVGLAVVFMRASQRRSGRRYQRGGQRAERRAERLLAKAGYSVEQRQPQARWEMWVDGQPVEVRCQADLLVRRRGRRFIAEVKSGEHGAKPTGAGTRRQLLEYAQAFPVDGVVLVDMRNARVHVVSFSRKES